MQEDALEKQITERVEQAKTGSNVSKSIALLSAIVFNKLTECSNGTREKVPTQDIHALALLSDVSMQLEPSKEEG